MSISALMAVFAHPDDEAFGTGGTLAKYAAEGHDVYVVTATRGEAGQIALPDLATPASLPAVREQELRCACEQAVGKLVRIIRQIRPQVMITFGPDGIYGHYDHLAVHRWATAAYDLAADAECFPDRDACETHQVSKLYYRVTPQEALDARIAAGQRTAVPMDGVPFPYVGAYVEAKRQGILCHATQVGIENRYAQAPEEVLADPWFRQETYLLARSTVGRLDGVEGDLLAGLR